jgi:hypothetical protein
LRKNVLGPLKASTDNCTGLAVKPLQGFACSASSQATNAPFTYPDFKSKAKVNVHFLQVHEDLEFIVKTVGQAIYLTLFGSWNSRTGSKGRYIYRFSSANLGYP